MTVGRTAVSTTSQQGKGCNDRIWVYQLELKFEGKATSKPDNLPEERKNLPMNDGNMIQDEDGS